MSTKPLQAQGLFHTSTRPSQEQGPFCTSTRPSEANTLYNAGSSLSMHLETETHQQSTPGEVRGYRFSHYHLGHQVLILTSCPWQLRSQPPVPCLLYKDKDSHVLSRNRLNHSYKAPSNPSRELPEAGYSAFPQYFLGHLASSMPLPSCEWGWRDGSAKTGLATHA